MSGYHQTVPMAIASFLLMLASLTIQAQSPKQEVFRNGTIEGTVRDSAGSPVSEAYVRLENTGHLKVLETKTDVRGNFLFTSVPAGTYVLRVQKSGATASAAEAVTLASSARKHVDFLLVSSGGSQSSAGFESMAGDMQLDNKTDFEVAGVKDWTAAGGHGSDAGLRASESLARDTRALDKSLPSNGSSTLQVASQAEQNLRAALVSRPGDFDLNHQLGQLYLRSGRSREAVPLLEAASRINPADYRNGYALAVAYQAAGDLQAARDEVLKLASKGEHAELDHLLGDIDEQLDDPLSAVREYQRATQMEPTEQNYFSWAVELLIHRAIEPAIEVFTQGSLRYPGSERMLEGLGAALYASGSYDKAAERLCAASDLSPRDPSPYLFLAKMELAAPQPLTCAERKLARFVHDQPQNAEANYNYAVALRKREHGAGKLATTGEIESLLEKAIALDPQLADAYVELGALYSARGDFQRAIAAYQKALEQNPNVSEAHFRLGQAYKRVGEAEKAQVEFQAYERSSKSEAARIDERRREVRQFVIVLKQQPEQPTPVSDKSNN
jgi:tetratricopeptide (TPR) repeat protein